MYALEKEVNLIFGWLRGGALEWVGKGEGI